MKREETEKKQKKIVKGAKRIRSIVMMSLLCVLMMSAATYAWFTLSNTAKLANLTMTVGEATGLQIAEDNNGSAGAFGGSITFPTIQGKLLPATSQDGKTFYEPTYAEDGTVESANTEADSKLPQEAATADTQGYYIEYSFWLKSLGTASSVKLEAGSGLTNANGVYSEQNTYKGTYILSETVDGTKGVPGSAAVRISFIKTADISTGTAKIFEPNSDISFSGLVAGTDYATDSTGVAIKTADVKHDKTGTIVTDGSIIELPAETPTKITMYIWIEGKDAECANQIAAKAIKGQLVFTNK